MSIKLDQSDLSTRLLSVNNLAVDFVISLQKLNLYSTVHRIGKSTVVMN